MKANATGYTLAMWPWTAPPEGVPVQQWKYAIVHGLTERYQPLGEIGVSYDKAFSDLYGPA